MIDFYNGQIINILPDNIKNDPVVVAISYAISNAVKKIVDQADKSGIYAVIDLLNEEALDLLAVELRTKYYGDYLSLDEKKEIIKKTLLWYCRAGTPYTVQELTDFVFQSAYIEEWFQYSSEPFLFRLIVNVISQEITLEKYISFLQALYEVKNTRSHLEMVIFQYKTETDVQTMAAGGIGNVIKVKAGVVKGIIAASENKPESVLRMNPNILIKARDITEDEVYTITEDGTRIKVFAESGQIIKTD